MQGLDKAISILKCSDRSQADLEFLSSYLLCLEDYRAYAKNLSPMLQIQLVNNLTICQVNRKTPLFKKGDKARTWFLILEGELELFHSFNNENKLIKRVTKGLQLGEREILRQEPYTLTCIPSRTSLLLSLTGQDFLSLLSDHLDSKLSQLRTFVHNYIPLIAPYSWSFKEKLGYELTVTEFKRGEIVIEKGKIYDKLYFVYEGEAVIAEENDFKGRNLDKLGLGSSFAEECTLMGKASLYCIKVSSEKALIAGMNKQEIFHLPDETLARLKSNLIEKVSSRGNLHYDIHSGQRSVSGTASPPFKSANRQVRDKFMSYILKNRPCTPKRILNISKVRNKELKGNLMSLRDCSAVKIRFADKSFTKSSMSHRINKSSLFN